MLDDPFVYLVGATMAPFDRGHGRRSSVPWTGGDMVVRGSPGDPVYLLHPYLNLDCFDLDCFVGTSLYSLSPAVNSGKLLSKWLRKGLGLEIL